MPITQNNMLTTQRLPHPINNVYIAEFLRRTLGAMPHNMFAKPAKIGRNQGDRASWMRWDNPTADITPQIEGTDPTPSQPSRTTISVQIKEYSALIKPSTWLDMTGWSQDALERVQWLADKMAITKDTLARNVLTGGASSITCSNGDPTATLLNETDLDAAITRLRTQNAIKLTKMLQAGINVGTSPLSPAFVVFAHEDLRHDIKNIAGFKGVKDYSDPKDAYPDEYGSAPDELRWILTTNGYLSSGNYSSIIVADQAYGSVALESNSNPMIYKSPEEAGSLTNAWSSLAYRFNDAIRILNDNYLCIMVSTKS